MNRRALRIKKMLKKLGITQRVIARDLQVSTGAISQYVKGTSKSRFFDEYIKSLGIVA